MGKVDFFYYYHADHMAKVFGYNLPIEFYFKCDKMRLTKTFSAILSDVEMMQMSSD